MLIFSGKYYLKCIGLSLLFYICGGFILAFFSTEEESILSVLIPLITTVSGVFIRIIILKRQLNKENVSGFESKDYFAISLPAVCLLILEAIIFVCDVSINKTGNIMWQSVFDSLQICAFALYPGGLTADGIIYNLSYWNSTAYYILLTANIVIYLLPALLYIWANERKTRDN